MSVEPFEKKAVLIVATIEVNPLELQSRLRDLGYYDGPVETEPWQETLKALRKFQSDHDLPVTGCPDPDTMRIMRETYCY